VIVIDSSSLGKYANKEDNWAEVEKKFAVEGSSTLEFAMHEVGNSIWKRILKKEISEQNALIVYREFVRAVFEDGLVTLVPAEPDLLSSSLELAIQEKVTTYDSAFIELAHKNKCELVTSDERQRVISKKRYPTMRVVYIR
jgi:predicted nucleic acid-binding protein